MVTQNRAKYSSESVDSKPLTRNNGSMAGLARSPSLEVVNNSPKSQLAEQVPGCSDVQLDKVSLHVIWRETDNRVKVLRARVREGSDVMAASEFARWLQFSGILRLLREQDFPLPCRGELLRREVELLVVECGEWFANQERSNVKPHPQIPRTELERINAQLASLTAAVKNLTPPNVETASVVNASLRVIEGGVK